jgi:hypothetical protein
MAWIESHTVLLRHRKLREVSRELRLKPVYIMGHLHALWHAALEQQEDGDLSAWSDEFIADQSAFDGDALQYVSLLQKHRWLDGKVLHDWLDYAGRYLISKYSTSNRGLLADIWLKHGRTYGKDKASEQRVNSECLANAPNLPTYQPTTSGETPEASSPPNDPIVLEFPTDGLRKTWELRKSKVAEYAVSFPSLDLRAEFAKARQWCIDNPKKRKTAAGMARFLSNWLGRAQDNRGQRKSEPSNTAPPEHKARVDREQAERQAHLAAEKAHEAQVRETIATLEPTQIALLMRDWRAQQPHLRTKDVDPTTHRGFRQWAWEQSQRKGAA